MGRATNRAKPLRGSRVAYGSRTIATVADTSAPGEHARRISWGNRLLAPLALIVVLIAIVAIVTANTGDDGNTRAGHEGADQRRRTPAATARAPENPKTYVVEEGDTLGAIAEKFDVSVKRLERLNPDIDPQTLERRTRAEDPLDAASADVRSRAPRGRCRRMSALALAAVALLARPSVTAAAAGAPASRRRELDAATWLLIDPADGERARRHGPDRRARDREHDEADDRLSGAARSCRWTTSSTVPAYSAAPAESVAGLIEGERLTVRDLLVAMMLPSANDAAETIADGRLGLGAGVRRRDEPRRRRARPRPTPTTRTRSASTTTGNYSTAARPHRPRARAARRQALPQDRREAARRR